VGFCGAEFLDKGLDTPAYVVVAQPLRGAALRCGDVDGCNGSRRLAVTKNHDALSVVLGLVDDAEPGDWRSMRSLNGRWRARRSR